MGDLIAPEEGLTIAQKDSRRGRRHSDRGNDLEYRTLSSL
jgi:hypothetical protein